MRVSAEVIGVYVLSSDGEEATYVGRSDFDLQQRILQSASEGHYVAFWFNYATSPMDAYKYECELYHENNPPDNAIHPAVPQNANWRCPVEGCEWSQHSHLDDPFTFWIPPIIAAGGALFATLYVFWRTQTLRSLHFLPLTVWHS